MTTITPVPTRVSIRRVALVEDHAMVRSAIRDVLAGTRLQVVGEFGSAEDALRELPALRPDVALVDLYLPGMSGAALVRELSPRLPMTRFVVLTASRDDRDLFEAVRCGARGYLSKELDFDGLVRALQALERGELAFSRRFESVLFDRFVFSHAADDGSGRSLAELTDRENEILALLSDGMSDRAIAETLVIGRRTVESHVAHILHKLGVSRRIEAAKVYREHLVEGAYLAHALDFESDAVVVEEFENLSLSMDATAALAVAAAMFVVRRIVRRRAA